MPSLLHTGSFIAFAGRSVLISVQVMAETQKKEKFKKKLKFIKKCCFVHCINHNRGEINDLRDLKFTSGLGGSNFFRGGGHTFFGLV